MGTRTEIHSAVPPCLQGLPCRSPRCQHTGCPVTQATRQKILRKFPFPSALGGPFAAPLFALLSALQNSLWMRLQFYFRVKGLCYRFVLLNYTFVRLSSTFFRARRNVLPSAPQCDKMNLNFSLSSCCTGAGAPCLPLTREVPRRGGGREIRCDSLLFSPPVSFADSPLVRGGLGAVHTSTAR